MNRRTFFLTLAALPTVNKWLTKLGIRKPRPLPIDFLALENWFEIEPKPLGYYQSADMYGPYMGISRENWELQGYLNRLYSEVAENFSKQLDREILGDTRPV